MRLIAFSEIFILKLPFFLISLEKQSCVTEHVKKL